MWNPRSPTIRQKTWLHHSSSGRNRQSPLNFTPWETREARPWRSVAEARPWRSVAAMAAGEPHTTNLSSRVRPACPCLTLGPPSPLPSLCLPVIPGLPCFTPTQQKPLLPTHPANRRGAGGVQALKPSESLALLQPLLSVAPLADACWQAPHVFTVFLITEPVKVEDNLLIY